MDNEYKLPIETPEITCFLHHTHYLAALKMHPSYENWLFSNFIQLVLRKDCLEVQKPGDHLLNFYKLDYSYGIHHACPFMNLQIINSELLMSLNNNIIQILKTFLLYKNYVNIYLDDYYIPSKIQYQKNHFIHDHLIHGFNDHSFLSYGYDNMGNLLSSYIEFETMKQAILNNEKFPVNLFSPNLNIHTPLDLLNIKELLNDYVNSLDTSTRLRMINTPKNNRVYGIDIYFYLNKYLNNIKISNDIIDLRVISVLLDHKGCMYKRICFLMQNKYMINKDNLVQIFHDIYKDTQRIGNLAIKYNLTLNCSLIEIIQRKLSLIVQIEKTALEDIINIIEV